MFLVILVIGVLSVSAVPLNDVVPQNVITVPPNCPEGQELINGECRDIWRNGPTTPVPLGDNFYPKNVVTVPSNCPPGQQLINGQCRDIWRNGGLALGQAVNPKNVITVPSNCPPGQQLINGQCRDIWRALLTESKLLEKLIEYQLAKSADSYSRQAEGENEVLIAESPQIDGQRNIINVPNQCPAGYRPDALGICRREFDR